jgi:hypothetical protein
VESGRSPSFYNSECGEYVFTAFTIVWSPLIHTPWAGAAKGWTPCTVTGHGVAIRLEQCFPNKLPPETAKLKYAKNSDLPLKYNGNFRPVVGTTGVNSRALTTASLSCLLSHIHMFLRIRKNILGVTPLRRVCHHWSTDLINSGI